MLTLHELPPLLRAGAGDGQGELVHGDAPRDGKVVDALVRRLPRQQLPQHHAVAATNTDSFMAYSLHRPKTGCKYEVHYNSTCQFSGLVVLVK